MSQTHLGAAVGVSFQQIQKYERGVNRIAASTLFQIAVVLGVSPCDFFEGMGSAGCSEAAWPGMADPQTRHLLDGFTRIPSPQARARIVDLVQALALKD
jgi:transcriptional regulator with XRE-family HTH domain